jgi:hypothetical protein
MLAVEVEQVVLLQELEALVAVELVMPQQVLLTLVAVVAQVIVQALLADQAL